mgnify:FL=1
MNRMRKWALTLAVTVGISSIAWAAPVYKDVPAWGKIAVQKVADEGLMVGNSAGQFLPEQVVNKFDLVTILAKVAGYKDPLIDATITAEEKQYNENAYNQYKGTLERAAQMFKRWDQSKNHRIAYLLQKGVFKESDLNQFINSKGEVLPLKREELTMYLVRLLGKEQEALGNTAITGFADDSAISQQTKPYVAQLKKLGLVQGDTNNKFNPKMDVNRVALAVFLANTLEYMEKQTPSVPNQPNGSQEQSFMGVLKNTQHLSRGLLVITDGTGKDLMYRIPTDIQIWKDSRRLTLEELREGMQVSVKVREGSQGMEEIFSVQVLLDSTTIQPPQNPSVKTQKIQGIVAKTGTQGKNDTITIKQQILLWGNIYEQEQTYVIVPQADLKKDEKAIGVWNIEVGDMIEAEVDMSQLYRGTILSREREVKGTIVDRTYLDGQTTISVKSDDGRVERYKITNKSEVRKKNYNAAKWSNLRIGDKVTVKVDYDEVVTLYAEGWRQRISGTVESILIAPVCKMTITDKDGKTKEYAILPSVAISSSSSTVASIYDLRLGQEVELNLESEEVGSIHIARQKVDTTYQGTIEDISNDRKVITIKVNQGGNSDLGFLRQFYITSDTKAYNRSSTLNPRNLKLYSEVLIYTNADGKTADIIHILD